MSIPVENGYDKYINLAYYKSKQVEIQHTLYSGTLTEPKRTSFETKIQILFFRSRNWNQYLKLKFFRYPIIFFLCVLIHDIVVLSAE